MAKGVKTAYAAHRLSALTAVPFSSRNRFRLDYRFKDLVSIENQSSTDLKLLPPPRFVLNFPNDIIRISGMYSTIIVSLRGIPDPLTIGDLSKVYSKRQRTITRLELSKNRAGTSEHHYFVFIYLLPEFSTVARCKLSPTSTTTAANDHYTNAPCSRGHCVD